VCNATNGIEPPRDYLSIKKSKKGTLKQIVPGYPHLKNNYTLLWDMKSMDGYLNIMAVIQKFFDQAISTNTSYNPQHYEGAEVPASVLIGDLLRSYQLGIKTLYYQNTYDGKGEEEIEVNDLHAEPSQVGGLSATEMLELDEDCDSCSI
jgi:ribonucleoside-diphosphate reductase alpha chain